MTTRLAGQGIPAPGDDLVHRFFSGTGPTYDLIANLCTIGCDTFWKKKILKHIPESPAKMMDQACGTGILTIKLALAFPESRVFGVELRNEYLRIALKKAADIRLDNIQFVQGRAEDVFFTEQFDCVTSSYLAKYADFDTLIPNLKKMLRPGGVLIMHDFTYPPGLIFSSLWEFYFKILQTLGARAFPQWRTVFFELPILLRRTKWVPELIRLLESHHFIHIRKETFTFGTSTLVVAAKP